MKKPTTIKLKNGLRILLVPMVGQETATALVLVETGSKYELKKFNGISHFLEHMCFKGTIRRPTQQVIAEELDGLGAEFNAFTGHEYTGYYVKASAGFLPQIIDLLSDIYKNSLFKEDDINQEKGAIVGEISMYEDVPMRKVGDLFMKLVYGDQPAGWEIAGSKDVITTFTKEDFENYRKQHYVPSATTVVVAGKLNQQKVSALLRRHFEEIPKSKKQSKVPVDDRQSKPQVLLSQKASDQTHLILGVRAYPLGHPKYYALSVLGGILGAGMSSRLFQKVRTEMGLGYYVRASHDAFTDHGIFTASAGVVNERAKEAVAAILHEFEKLKNEPVGKEELKKTKDMLAGRLILGLESSDEFAEYYGFQEVLQRKLATSEEIIAKINRVTVQDIQKVAKELFITQHLNLALIGPWEKKEEFLPLLHFSK